MTVELFSDAMNEIGAKYVEEALYYERPKKRSFFAEAAKRATAVLLAPSLLFAAFTAASPDARASLIHWIETWTGSQVSYQYAGDAPADKLPFYTLTALPDGYALNAEMSYEDSGFRQLCYESSDDLIIFSCIYMQDNAFSYYDMGEDTEIFEVTVNGCKGKLFLPSDPTLWSTLEWIDERSNLHFSLDACGDREAMLRLAESAAITERPADFPQPEEKEPTSMNDITGEKVEP